MHVAAVSRKLCVRGRVDTIDSLSVGVGGRWAVVLDQDMFVGVVVRWQCDKVHGDTIDNQPWACE